MWDNIKDTIVQYSGKIVGAIIIFIVGWYICKFLGKVIERALAKSRLEDTAAGFISNVCKYTLRIILLIIVITHLGVNMTSIVALITSAALAVGMALQGSLSNIAGGLLLLVNKPFTVNDYISDGTNSGTVLSIHLIYTTLLTENGETISMPNGNLAGSTIINYTRAGRRRLVLTFSLLYDQTFPEARKTLLEIAQSNPLVLKDPPPEVHVNDLKANNVEIIMYMWTATKDYWTVYYELRESVKEAFEAHTILMPRQQIEVNVSHTPE
jgi:small conductance mechanosensitive channel